jgi:hypothetical protein
MKKAIVFPSVFFICLGIAAGARAGMLDAYRIDIGEAADVPEIVCPHCPHIHSIFFQNYTLGGRLDLGLDTVYRTFPMIGFANGSPQNNPERDLFIAPPSIVGDYWGGSVASDITTGRSLTGWCSVEAAGISNTPWLIFDDFPIDTLTLVEDDTDASDQTDPFPASVLMLSSVFIGLIGFRRTPEPLAVLYHVPSCWSPSHTLNPTSLQCMRQFTPI